ncbi:DUF262 domain-containing protein [Azospirillum sp. Sh1]|uniref:HNH endonuclease family protein n=1 Tax=Azospirillum sp. Sh1 TaxID=2607285 RepID=UPI0011ED58EA|nr:DUF262 domain-containing protein [Azospirillum sp. Sh1]KAA0570849.1 DUF262 domain-containing protein [Azospirillum sp. Sh1]
MAVRSKLVNLDAMIKREDFAMSDAEPEGFENVSTISLRDFTKGGLIGPNLRKPDFQRETNHWGPEQVVSLLECFVSGDLIPSVILWQSPTYLFVIDGGHRLSALRAWVEDDYGDGPLSQEYFGYQISQEQRSIADRTRQLVNRRIGSWKHFESRNAQVIDPTERKKLNAIVSRGLPIQWVKGDADKAESSFFKINTNGTPLDRIEELLLKNRRKPIPIAARAIIRAGKGHRYWSLFPIETAERIENTAKEIHTLLFDPEIKSPVKTLDLPLGGPKGVRDALQVLIEVVQIAICGVDYEKVKIETLPDDKDGEETVDTLKEVLRLIKRLTGNDNGSLGLHPAVYFYGPTGRHSGPMFMGTLALFAEKLDNNDSEYFVKFSKVRSDLEGILIKHKELIATIMQKQVSNKRAKSYNNMLKGVVKSLLLEQPITEAELVSLSGLAGKIVVGSSTDRSVDFSDDTKSEAFIRGALSTSMKCSICNGYLDPGKSISYDHVIRKRDGGRGTSENCALTHPYCNQATKN